MKNYKSQSTELPVDVDITNDNVVLVNSNPIEIPATEDTPKMYEYDVAEYTKDEYIKELMRKDSENSKAIDELTIAILEG